VKTPPFDLRTAILEPGTVLLEASAGTGKTYTLVGILLRLLLERHIERLDQALVVTFTVAATDELKNRLRTALRTTLRAAEGDTDSVDSFHRELARRPGAATILRQALDGFDEVGIATIHSFCKRLLERAAFETHEPFALEFTVDPLPLLYRAAADALRMQYRPGVTARSALLQLGNHGPPALVDTYRLWRRHPQVTLSPWPADLEPRLAAVDEALTAAAAVFDARTEQILRDVEWLAKKSPFGDDPDGDMVRLRARLAAQPAIALDVLLACAPNASTQRAKKASLPRLRGPFFVACDELWRTVHEALPHLRSELLARMHERVERGKRADNVLGFDDLLLRAHAALHDEARRPVLLQAIREQYTVALIDEFQDTDSLQYDVFADCFAGRTLFLIGDPKQAIYGFRGADLRTYLAAREHAVRRHTLADNYRSSAAMVAAVGTLFTHHARPFVTPEIDAPAIAAAAAPDALRITGDGDAVFRWRFVPPNADGEFWNKHDAEARIAADVAAEASRLLRSAARLDGRPLRPNDLAVLTRTNRQAVVIQDALRACGIPSAIGKAGDIFQTDELAELQRFLQAVLQPGDLRRVRVAMATRLWGLDAAALRALDDDDERLEAHLESLARWRRLWLRRGLVVMLEQALADLRVHARWLSWHGGERRLTNLRQLIEILHDAEHAHRLSPEGVLEWLLEERANQDDLDYTLRELRLESDDDAVQILTVHGSKGLQYEVVFCPFLWDAKDPRTTDLVPTGEHGHDLAFDLNVRNPLRSHLQRERLTEDARLAYVAVTRARRRCYVHWGATCTAAAGSAPTWLVASRHEQPPATEDRARESWVVAWQDRMKAAVGRWRGHLDALVATSGGTMSAVDVAEAPMPERVPRPPATALHPARTTSRVLAARGLHSFSSLVAVAHAQEQAPEPVPDRDDAPLAGRAAPAPSTPARGIFAFARGAAAGQCLHTILEHVELHAAASPATADVVRATLEQTGLLDADAHEGEIDPVPDVQRALVDLGQALAFPGGPTLASLCAGTRQVEWQFALPAARADFAELVTAFAESSSEPARRQAERLRALPPQTLRGFLVGFVDLVVEHDGRYWVLDWKSNHLGNDASDYTPSALATAMHEHDYVLQYHLYVLALHRHLRERLPGYDHERHMGGVVYAFLRGAMPGSACGMVFHRVPVALVDAMDRWIANGLTSSTAKARR
jgi:exodeoxyribonuclease V beta subunit